jgi:hypothetical protein
VAGEPTELNPYAPPASDVDSVPAGPAEDAFPKPLFSPRQMLAAAVFGSVVAGVILLQANYRAMARRGDANRTLLLGALASLAFFAVMYFLPEKVPTTPINIAAALTFYKLADTMQGAAFSRHRAAKGERQSNWLVFGITLGTAVVLLVSIFLLVFASGGLNDVV